MDNVIGKGFSQLGTTVHQILDRAGEARDHAVQAVVDRTPFGQAGRAMGGDTSEVTGGGRVSSLGLR